MTSGFKDVFNAAHEKQEKKSMNAQFSLDNYIKTASREYPRLCEKLVNEVQELFNGVKGADVKITTSEETIDHFDGKKVVSLAKVNVKSIEVKFGGRYIVFRPAGVNYMGIQGKIEVKTSHENPFVKQGVFLASKKDNQDEWQLATLDRNNRPVALNGEMLQDLLKRALL